MQKKYYIQRGSENAKDIYADFGVMVKETSGLNEMPKLKKIHSENWPDEQGKDYYIPQNNLFEEKKVSITFIISSHGAKSKLRNFLLFLLARGDFSYFDTYKKEGFRGIYNSNKINSEKYRDNGDWIEFSIDFIAPNGIGFGFDNEGQTSMDIKINGGSVDAYFSDGTQILGQTENFIRSQNGGFAIFCPTILDGVNVQNRDNITLGIDGKLMGIQGDNSENIIFGI